MRSPALVDVLHEQGDAGKVCTMSASHVAWSSIELLHNVVRTLAILERTPRVDYRAKVKLHGANCAVQITKTGLVAQSRTSLLTPGDDFKGFAAWVATRSAYFTALPAGLAVFGEWCGPGIEKGMAISAVPAKQFAVFAVQRGDELIVEPDAIRALVPAGPADVHVLPWEDLAFTIDFASRASLDAAAALLNTAVAEVEREDPWVRRTFGISGLGEGLVLYPTPYAPELMFKAKGEKHRTVGTKAAVTVDPATAASIDELVALLVTDARLAQGAGAVGGRDPKLTGAFLEWIVGDVRKECSAELAASGLAFAQIEKAVRARARAWFLAR